MTLYRWHELTPTQKLAVAERTEAFGMMTVAEDAIREVSAGHEDEAIAAAGEFRRLVRRAVKER